MSVRFYDEALTQKIQGWIGDSNLKVMSPDNSGRLFSMLADMNNDKPLSLPIISLSRGSNVELDFPHKQPLSFDGKMIDHTDKYSYQLDAIPMKLNYQLDIYTRTAEEGDEYLRSLLFNLINHPKFQIDLPYNGKHYPIDAYISVESTVSDNSDVPQKLISDQFTRWTIGLSIQKAYFMSIRKYDLVTAEISDVTEKGEE